MEYVYLHCMLDERNKADWGIQSEKYKENVYKLLNQEKKEDLPPEEYGAMKFTRENILQNYNSKDCLFSGTMVSDDYFSMSKRAGRNGSLYATPNFDYAKIYDGINCGHGEGVSATGDFYHSLSADVYGKKMRIGFINVYQQNNNENKYFTNFGLERGRVRQHSLENKTDEKAETYITEEKNPQIAKIMHIQIQGEQRWTDYFWDITNDKTPQIQRIKDCSKADINETFNTKPDVLLRLNQQYEEYQKGVIRGNISINKSPNVVGLMINRQAQR